MATITLMESSRIEENRQADEKLKELKDVKEIEIVYMPPTKIVEEFEAFPAITTPDGQKFFGLDSINDYVEQELETSNGGNGNGKK